MASIKYSKFINEGNEVFVPLKDARANQKKAIMDFAQKLRVRLAETDKTDKADRTNLDYIHGWDDRDEVVWMELIKLIDEVV